MNLLQKAGGDTNFFLAVCLASLKLREFNRNYPFFLKLLPS